MTTVFDDAGTAEHVERIVRGWRRVDRIAEAKQSTQRHRSRALHVYQDEDGAGDRGRADEGARRGPRGAVPTNEKRFRGNAQRRCRGTACVQPAAGQRAGPARRDGPPSRDRSGPPGERYQVVVHVDAPVLAETDVPADPDAPGQSALEDGAHVSAETSRRLACDATRVVMRHDADGRVTEVGARTRTIPPALRRALQHRDRSCRFPGCGLSFGQGHHIRHWARGGPTTLSNLALLCRRHHRTVHEDGYQIERQPDGELCFRRPDGQLLRQVPLPVTVPRDPVAAIRAQNDALRLHVDAPASTPNLLGERLDVGWGINVLHPLAASPRY